MILYCIRFSKASLPLGQKLDVDADVSDVAHRTLVLQATKLCEENPRVLFCSVIMRTNTNQYTNTFIPLQFV